MVPGTFGKSGLAVIRRPTSIAFAAALVATTSAAAQQSARSPNLAELDACITRAVRDWRIPGRAVAVIKEDSIVLAKGYGVRELGKPDRVGAGTRFAIGSTTKATTAVALDMLADEGKVRWDDPVIRHLLGFRVNDPFVARELTVRDLLTHRGGLGNADQLWSSTDYTTEDIIRRVAKWSRRFRGGHGQRFAAQPHLLAARHECDGSNARGS